MVVGEGLLSAARFALRVVACGNALSLALESNLGRSFSSFPAWAEYLIADSLGSSGTFESDGGGGRIRTFEVDDGRFTVCSLWPLGNPTRGNSNFEVMLEMVVGEGLFVASLLTLRAVACGNVLSLSLESNLSRRFSPFPDECKLSQSHRSYHIAVVNYGVGEGFEPSKSMTADLQSAPFGRSGTPPRGNAFYWPAPLSGSGAHHIK